MTVNINTTLENVSKVKNNHNMNNAGQDAPKKQKHLFRKTTHD
jgi:hypothetical protein